MFSSPPATLPGLGFWFKTAPNFDAYSLYQSTMRQMARAAVAEEYEDEVALLLARRLAQLYQLRKPDRLFTLKHLRRDRVNGHRRKLALGVSRLITEPDVIAEDAA